MSDIEFGDLSVEQQGLVRAVERLASESGESKVPLDVVEAAVGVDRTGLVELLTEPVLDRFLDYREDKPNSPGWLAVDRISGTN